MLESQLQSENIEFEVHKEIIHSLIKSQAGSPSKAFLELVMNSIDAGSTKVEITIDKNNFEVIDDGKGFSSEEEIHSFFKTFGTPHKEGDAIYGRFRMGRGQIMAFSKNSWRTNTFKMVVDIQKNGLGFDFIKGLPKFNGVEIKGSFYEPLTCQEYNNILNELKSFLKFSQIDTFINGTLINKSPKSLRGIIETEEAYIKVKENSGLYNSLEIYNLGVLVCKYPASKFGFSGIIISKKQLEVNFARNDILITQCKVWKKISKYLKNLSISKTDEKIKSKRNISSAERIHLATTMIDCSLTWKEVKNYPVFVDIQGKTFTFNKLFNQSVITLSDDNSTLDEKIHMSETALVLSKDIFTIFNIENISELKSILIGMFDRYNEHSLKIKLENIHFINIEVLRKDFNSDLIYLKDNQITKKQLASLKSIRRCQRYIVDLINCSNTNLSHKVLERQILAGESEIANGWTNGISTIAIEKNIFKYSDYGLSGWLYIAELLIHEYLHTNANNLHDISFYENFHNIIRNKPYTEGSFYDSYKENNLIRFVKKANSFYIKELEKHDYQISDKCLSLQSITKSRD